MVSAESARAAQAAPPQPQRLAVPRAWRRVDFISDLHLQSQDRATFLAWSRYMQQTCADAIFILGDLFEVWVGDDAIAPGPLPDDAPQAPFETAVASVLARTTQRCSVFFMHGNRDFLVGTGFLQRCGVQLLSDPCVLEFGDQRWLLSHGDALCWDDTDYMQFRRMVRSPVWTQQFLAQSLEQRRAIARDLRQRSESRKAAQVQWFDVDSDGARQWLGATQSTVLLHGHTHRPQDHDLGGGLQRIVLSDWDGAASPPRAQVLRLELPRPGQAAVFSRIAPELSAQHEVPK